MAVALANEPILAQKRNCGLQAGRRDESVHAAAPVETVSARPAGRAAGVAVDRRVAIRAGESRYPHADHAFLKTIRK